jgi:hypothetical protein
MLYHDFIVSDPAVVYVHINDWVFLHGYAYVCPLPLSRKLVIGTLVNSVPPSAPPPIPSSVPALTRERKRTAKQVSQIRCDKEKKQAKKVKLAKKPKTADIS